jgi:energy-coupling factor transporter ATP-binding protein EcfA2
VQRGLGYLPQEPSVFRALTVRDNVGAALEAKGRPPATRCAPRSIGSRSARRRTAGKLSGGERRRLEIARCLALEPSVLLLDEPFAGVDPVGVQDLQERIRELAMRGLGILLTDHAVREALGICDEAIILDAGTAMARGTPRRSRRTPASAPATSAIDSATSCPHPSTGAREPILLTRAGLQARSVAFLLASIQQACQLVLRWRARATKGVKGDEARSQPSATAFAATRHHGPAPAGDQAAPAEPSRARRPGAERDAREPDARRGARHRVEHGHGPEQALQDGATKQQEDVVEQNNGSENQESIDWQKVLEEYSSQNKAPSSGPSKFDELPPIENSLSTSESLADHLLWQLGMQAVTDDEYRAGARDHPQPRRARLARLAARDDRRGVGARPRIGHDAHELILGFDPIGCGARDLKECLTVQAKVTWPEDPNFVRILQDHLGEIETRNYQSIATKLGIEVEDVVEYHKMIQKLEPWPGRPFADAPPQYITPDITVVQVGGEWQILQNDDGLPRLRVSPYYKRILENGTLEEGGARLREGAARVRRLPHQEHLQATAHDSTR